MRKSNLFGIALLALSGAGGVAIALASPRPAPLHAHQESRSPGGPVPSVENAEVQAAIGQTQRVLDAVLAAGWRTGFPPRTVKSADLKLPAQRYAEAPTERQPGFVSYRFPFEEGYDPELAFYSETYVRRNIRHVKGDHMIADPQGFYIVAYRDGRVLPSPLGDARSQIIGPHPTIPDATMSKLVFPGMRHYDDPENTPAIPVDDQDRRVKTGAPNRR